MDILTYYERLDDYNTDLAERASNKLLGFLRTAIGKKVTVRLDYHGNKHTDEEYSSALKKTSIIVLAILLLPLSVLAATIGIIIIRFSSTHGKDLLNEKKITKDEEPLPVTPINENKEEEIPPSPPSRLQSLTPPSSPKLPPEIRIPFIGVQVGGEYQKLDQPQFIELIEKRGKEIECLEMKHITISLSVLLLNIPNVQILSFRNCHFENDDLSGFEAELPNLHKLNMIDCNLTSEQLLTLKEVRFTDLKTLDLSKNWIDDKGIPTLIQTFSKCRLHSLDLTENQISGVGTTAIGDSDSLHYLDELYLDGNPLDDDAIDNLFNRRRLNITTLSVTNEQLTDEGLEYLASWKNSNPANRLMLSTP